MSRVESTSRRAPSTPKLADVNSERVRREHDAKIVELQNTPSASMKFISNVQLADTVATPIPHGLGRAPKFVTESTPRGATAAGRIDEIRDGSQDRTKVIVLKATGFGATITIDVQVA